MLLEDEGNFIDDKECDALPTLTRTALQLFIQGPAQQQGSDQRLSGTYEDVSWPDGARILSIYTCNLTAV